MNEVFKELNHQAFKELEAARKSDRRNAPWMALQEAAAAKALYAFVHDNTHHGNQLAITAYQGMVAAHNLIVEIRAKYNLSKKRTEAAE